jgi:hypothetical protein
MELVYRLTREDHQRFCKLAVERVASHSKGPLGLKPAKVVLPLASALLTMLVLGYLFVDHVIDQLAFGISTLAYVWGVTCMQVCGWFWRRQYLANWLPDGSVSLSEMRLELDSDGVEGSDQTKVTKYSWRAFTDMSEHGKSIVLWVDRAQGILVPASALANEGTRREFVSLAHEHIARM